VLEATRVLYRARGSATGACPQQPAPRSSFKPRVPALSTRPTANPPSAPFMHQPAPSSCQTRWRPAACAPPTRRQPAAGPTRPAPRRSACARRCTKCCWSGSGTGCAAPAAPQQQANAVSLAAAMTQQEVVVVVVPASCGLRCQCCLHPCLPAPTKPSCARCIALPTHQAGCQLLQQRQEQEHGDVGGARQGDAPGLLPQQHGPPHPGKFLLERLHVVDLRRRTRWSQNAGAVQEPTCLHTRRTCAAALAAAVTRVSGEGRAGAPVASAWPQTCAARRRRRRRQLPGSRPAAGSPPARCCTPGPSAGRVKHRVWVAAAVLLLSPTAARPARLHPCAAATCLRRDVVACIAQQHHALGLQPCAPQHRADAAATSAAVGRASALRACPVLTPASLPLPGC